MEHSKGDPTEISNREKGKGRSFSPNQCHYCKKYGHVKRFYRKRITEEGGASFVHTEEVNDQDTMFMLFGTQEETTDDVWYLDSGCSNHMAGNRNLFISID